MKLLALIALLAATLAALLAPAAKLRTAGLTFRERIVFRLLVIGNELGVIVYDYADPAVLTGFVRNLPQTTAWILNRFLPDRTIPQIEAMWDRVNRTNRVAKFRAYDAQTPIGRRDTASRERIELPPLGQKLVVGEYERLQLERLRLGGDATAAIRENIFDDAEINTRAVRARMELARGDVLTDGKFTLTDENGLTLEADFGLPGGNLVAPAGALWSDHTNATPLADIRLWVQAYTNVVGEAPGFALTSSTIVSDLLLNAEIRALAATLGGTPSIVTQGVLNQVLQAHGLPPIVTYDAQVDVDGTTTRTLPVDRFVLLPANPADLGFTAWGITAEALELVEAGRITFTDAPGITGVVQKDFDPVRIWTKVAAVGMPIITDPNRLMVADVR